MTIETAKVALWVSYEKELVIGVVAIIGAAIAGMITTGSAALTLWATRKNLRIQLNHDRDQKKKDYDRAVKRDVYLGLAESISANLNLISGLANLDKEHADLFGTCEALQGQANKVHLVAGIDALSKLLVIQNAHGDAVMKLVAERNRMMELKNQMTAKRKAIEFQETQRDRYLEMVAMHQIDATPDTKRLTTLTDFFDFHNNKVIEIAKEHDLMRAKLLPWRAEFIEKCSKERVQLLNLLPPLVAALRHELGLEIDATQYTELLAKSPFVSKEIVGAALGLSHDQVADTIESQNTR